MDWESSDVVRFDLGPLLQGLTRIPKLKMLITRLLLVREVCNVKPIYRKSLVGNLLMWSDLTLDPPTSRLHEDTQTKNAYNSLIIGPRVLQCEF